MGKSIKILTVIILFFSVSNSFSQYYRDNDNDGYGAGIPYFFPEAGYNYATNDDDCNDNNPAINPSKPEKCNGVDDNCNGQVDDGVVLPATAGGSNVARCGTGTVTLTATVGSGGNTIRWYSAASGGTLLHTGTSYTTPSIGSTTSYYAESYNSLTFCKASTRKQIQALINPIPATAGGSNVARCGTGTVTLTATVGSGGNTIRWYSAASGGTLLHTGTSYTTPSIGSTTSYYAESYNSSTGCKASTRKQIQAVINPIPATAGGSNVARCGTGTVTLTATVGSGGNTIRWYSAASGGTLLHTGTSYTTPSIGSTTSYYAESYNSSTGCKASSRKQIQAVINPIPATAGGSNVARCGTGTVTLTATVGSGGNTIRWYSAASGGTLLHTGTSYTTPSIGSTTSYYAESYNSSTGCKASSRKQIQAVINAPPTWYADTDGDGFGNPSATLSDCNQPVGYVSNNSDYDDSTNMITNLAPQTFYLDKDGDGFGETTPTIYASFKPLGYANNTLDQCPDVPGATNGCDYQSPVFSDENYIFSQTYQSPMSSPSAIKSNRDVVESITYFDGLGRAKQQIAIKGSLKQSNVISPNYPAGWTMDWTEGATATPFFNRNGNAAENNIITGPDPFGKSALIWACGNDPANNGDGGWNTDYITVDKTKTYRYTVWVRRDFSQDGTTYHGTQNVDNLGGGANSNPYFWNGDLPQLSEWYLLVGIVHPYGHAAGDSGVSGLYDMQGNKVLDGTEFKWGSTTTTSRFRSYLYYATDVNVRQYFYQPILEIVDGNEVPLADMFGNWGSSDLISHVSYDSFGRQDKEWLPYPEPSGSLGSYRGDVSATTQQYYQGKFAQDFTGLATNQVNAYSEKDFEASPLSRILEQAAPGKDWQLGGGHGIKFDYETNTTSEVRLYNVTLTVSNNTYTPSLVANGHYASGELTKSVTKDENHDGTNSKLHTTEEFTDKLGRVVLKRTYAMVNSVVTPHDTYYVYDNYGNLTYVLPPLVDTANGVSAPELSELCYQYKYDHRNRLVEKKIPGKGWEYIVYNTLDQPIMTQDANQNMAGEWLFTKYDALGRVTYTGIDTGNANDRATVQSGADGQPNQFESRTAGANTYVGTTVYYGKTAYPTSFDAVYTINYYDTYADTDGLAVPATVLGQATTTSTQGLATVSKIRVLGTSDWITTITGYDVKGRAIYSASKNNYLNTTDIVETKLDFVGKVLETKTTHQRTGYSDIVTVDTFTYDDLGRLLTQKQTITGQPEENLVNNGYDELGQLTTKQVGGGLQTVDYTYNVRGWLKAINDPNALGNDLFAFGINYNTQDHGGATLFNGNIAETEWKTANDNTLRWYRYGYDPLNRITSATANSANYNLSGVTYDKNGNIKTLTRMGHTNNGATTFGTMDNLIYTYDSGNKLLKVLDNGNDTYGFKDGVDQTTEYTYDANGNMTSDLNKGITGIEYNHLNLPTKVTVTGSNAGTIDYVYVADGVKLKEITVKNGVGTTETEYAGGKIYENGVLQFFGHSEGYVTPDGSGNYDYVYNYVDHLGNVRLSYTDSNGDGSVDPSNEIIEENNYYPFGLKHQGYNGNVSSLGNSVAKQWKYNGKELNQELGLDWYDYGMRMYDPAIARFMTIDLAGELMKQYTPYAYSFNSPVMFEDKDGNFPTLAVFGGTDPIKKLMSGPKVDMTNAPKSSPTNAKGFPRNSRWFWNQMVEKNPGMFSAKNKALIKAGQSPVIDPKWVEFNPSHASYKGKLVHHHVDQGRFAVGIPEQAHKELNAKLHPRTGSKARGFFKNSMKFMNVLAVGLVMFDAFSDSPDSMGNLFSQSSGNIKEGKIYKNRDGGYYSISDREFQKNEDGEVESVTATVTLYRDYQYNEETGEYEGVGQYDQATVKQYKGKQAQEVFRNLQNQL